eukprot:Rmarinus@m.16650
MTTFARALSAYNPTYLLFSNQASQVAWNSSRWASTGSSVPWIAPWKRNRKKPADICRSEDDADFRKIIDNNRAVMKRRLDDNPNYYKELGTKMQQPKYLYIGCSDSRIPANEICGLEPGDLFVHRNIANLVVNTDMNLLSVLQYAVEVLKVKHVMICGHYGCGGVQAAVQNDDLGLIENWLRNIRDVHRLHHVELDAIVDDDARMRRLVELNVAEQCLNLYKTGIVQRSRKETGYPRIHGLVYDIKEGRLDELSINVQSYRKRHDHIYKLYA